MLVALVAIALAGAPPPNQPPDAWTKPYLGAWKVSLTETMSTCPDRAALGVTTIDEQWTLTANGWEIHVAVANAKTASSAYTGVYAGSKNELQLDDGNRSSARLAGTPQKLEGELVQVQHARGPRGDVTCAATYHVSASR
ncbi:MAG: hypothetical protein JST54_27685 [Deltaproteobacteria bacterium]|nr:hypothetical protein [Deltaproteobacteria bacterium]